MIRPASAQPRPQPRVETTRRSQTPSPVRERDRIPPSPTPQPLPSSRNEYQSRPHPANLRDVVIDSQYEASYLHFGDVDQVRLEKETKVDFLTMSFYTSFLHSLICIGLTPDVSATLKTNYLVRVYNYDQKKKRFNVLYLLSSMTIMLGSILTSLTLTIQGIPDNNQADWANFIWWVSLIISVTVSVFTSINRIFALDRNFFINKNTYDSLVAEGNDFIALSNKYRNYWKDPRPHYSAVPYFLENINNIVKHSNQLSGRTNPSDNLPQTAPNRNSQR